MENSFKKQLDEHYSWPDEYLFKFIVPKGKEKAFYNIIKGADLKFKESSGGKYVSVSAKVLIHSSDEIIKIYEEAYQIEGVISL